MSDFFGDGVRHRRQAGAEVLENRARDNEIDVFLHHRFGERFQRLGEARFRLENVSEDAAILFGHVLVTDALVRGGGELLFHRFGRWKSNTTANDPYTPYMDND